jgi:apolipoprotein N-acyltransferase
MLLIKRYKSLFSNQLIVLISGLSMGLTTIFSGAWILAWISLIPLWKLLFKDQNPRLSVGRATLLGLLWGIGYHGLSLYWIVSIHPLTWMGMNWISSLAITLLCFIFTTLWGSIFVAM